MNQVYWLLLTIVLYGGMFLLVPLRKIRDYFSFGLLFGPGLALLIMFVGVSLFSLWEIRQPLIPIADFDLSLVLDWFPPVIIFCHYLRRFSNNWISLISYILIFASASTIAKIYLSYFDLWVDIRWSSFHSFLLGISTHLLMSFYLILRGNLPKPSKII